MADITLTFTKDYNTIVSNLSGMKGKAGKQLKAVFNKFTADIFTDLAYRSPIQKGEYKRDWDRVPVSSVGSFAAYQFTNNMDYASIMETGSGIGGKPWPNAGPKTVVKDGRIWSKQMPEPVLGGAIEAADFEGLQKQLSTIIGGSI